MKEKFIDLDAFIHTKATALIGRDDGEDMLEKLLQAGLDFSELENNYDVIEIKIPQRIISINRSYFLGLFETRVIPLGKDNFISKYRFNTTKHIKNKIEEHVDYALLKASQRDILDV